MWRAALAAKRAAFFVVAHEVLAGEVLFGEEGAGVVVFLADGFVEPFDAFGGVGGEVFAFEQEFASSAWAAGMSAWAAMRRW